MSDDAKIPVEVHPVDVGQGDCFLVVFKEVKEPTNDDGQRGDYVIMIDGGVQWRSECENSDFSNLGFSHAQPTGTSWNCFSFLFICRWHNK